jgi:hypothetical protein
VRLRLDDDEPMDLLEGAAMRITGFFLRHWQSCLNETDFETI